MPILTGHVYEFQMIGQAQNYSAMIVPHFRCKLSPPTDETGLLELKNNFQAYLRTMQINRWGWTHWKYRQVNSDPPGAYSQYFFDLSSGLITGNLGPQQIAKLFSIYTSLNTKSGKGRIYLPGVSPTDYQNGVYIGSTLTDMATFVTNVKNRYGPGGASPYWELGVWSRTGGATPFFNVMVEIKARLQPAVRRSRRAHLPY